MSNDANKRASMTSSTTRPDPNPAGEELEEHGEVDDEAGSDDADDEADSDDANESEGPEDDVR
jgi:hypothetical protein